MAKYVSAAVGDFGTAASWDTVGFDSGFDATAANQITGSLVSDVFTAPSLTDSATGVVVFFTSGVATDIITATLQEFNGATWNDVASGQIDFTLAEAPPNSCWVYFRLSTPYTYTTTTAGYYRYKFTRSGGGAYFLTGDGSGNPFILATDDRNATPGVNDDVYIMGHNGTNTPITITVTGSQNCGSGGGGAASQLQRSDNGGIHIGVGGTLTWDRTADSDLTNKGHIIVGRGGNFELGTTASPIPAAYTATLYMDEDGVAGNYGIHIIDGCAFKIQGRAITGDLWKTTYASGVGTAADPFIVHGSVDWTVGDEIMIAPASANTTNYQETEYKYIKTKNSATSYVLSDTPGGAESALTYTHAGNAHVVNITRNARIESTNSTYDFFINDDNTTSGAVDIDWAGFLGIGGSNAGVDQQRKGLNMVANARYLNVDYSVFTESSKLAMNLRQNKITHTFTGLVFCKGAALADNTGQLVITTNANTKEFIDCFFMDTERLGAQVTTAFNITFTDCVFAGNNSDGNANSGGIYILTAGVNFNNCKFFCNRTQAIKAGAWVSESIDTEFGVLGANGSQDIGFFDEYLHDVTLTNCKFDNTPDFIQSTYVNMLEGSEYRFHKFDQEENNHLWYTPNGIGRSTGAGLVDTTVRTSGSLALRIGAENDDPGFSWEYKVLASAGQGVQSYGFIKKDATFGSDDVLVELFLPGSSSADDSALMPNDTEWNVFSLGALYSGAVDGYATIRITAKTTSGGYIYVDDIANGTNEIIALDVWDDGKPSPIMFEQLGDSDAPWAVLTSTLTTPGTTGRKLVDGLTKQQFIALDE